MPDLGNDKMKKNSIELKIEQGNSGVHGPQRGPRGLSSPPIFLIATALVRADWAMTVRLDLLRREAPLLVPCSADLGRFAGSLFVQVLRSSSCLPCCGSLFDVQR